MSEFYFCLFCLSSFLFSFIIPVTIYRCEIKSICPFRDRQASVFFVFCYLLVMPSLTSLWVLFLVFACAHGAFKHPGVVLNQGQIDFVKAKLAAKAEPWTAAFNKARYSSWGSLSWVPHPYAVVECGPSNKPNIGCTAETNDSRVAYTQAILWQYTGNTQYLQKSIQIMDAWSATIKLHNNSNAPLQAGWVAEHFTKAAELVKHLGNGAWPAANVQRFATMLTTKYLPLIIDGSVWSNGNWDLTMIDAILGIAVFTDNQTLFDKGVSMWRARVPAYFYLAPPDGALPNPPPGGKWSTTARLLEFWYNTGATVGNGLPFPNGLCQETCRDLNHAAMGTASLTLAAETALIQGKCVHACCCGYSMHV